MKLNFFSTRAGKEFLVIAGIVVVIVGAVGAYENFVVAKGLREEMRINIRGKNYLCTSGVSRNEKFITFSCRQVGE